MERINSNIDFFINMVCSDKSFIKPGGICKVIVYKDRLVKIDHELYRAAFSKSRERVEQYIKSMFFNFYYKVNLNQINYLTKCQNNIKLTSLPTGVLLVDNVPCGVLLKYHKDYYSLSELELSDAKHILRLAREILIRIKELDVNNICQLDLHGNNILFRNNNIELIDLDGPYIRISSNKELKSIMYRDYLYILIEMFEKSLENNYLAYLSSIDVNNSSTSSECFKILDRLNRI